MSRRSRGKIRFARRKAHAVITSGRPGLVAAAVVLDEAVPTRAPCPECGYSQKVKRDGTMGTHLTGKTIADKQCPGTGKRYNA